VDSNDSLYASDPKYIKEVCGICSTLVEEILAHLKTLTTPEVSLVLIYKHILHLFLIFYKLLSEHIENLELLNILFAKKKVKL
jgi:hypothetical protein